MNRRHPSLNPLIGIVLLPICLVGLLLSMLADLGGWRWAQRAEASLRDWVDRINS